MFAIKTSNWFHTKEILQVYLVYYVFSLNTSNYLQSRQVNGFSPMRIFQVMMNGSEQWDDSMSIDETRMKWKQIQQFNIITFFEINPLNRSKLYLKSFKKTSKWFPTSEKCHLNSQAQDEMLSFVPRVSHDNYQN